MSVKRWTVGATLWLSSMTGAWIAFGLLALTSPATLDHLWGRVQDLPLAAEIALWIATFPLTLALAVYNSSWADWVQITLISLFAIGWTLASIPRRKPAERGRIQWEIRSGHPHDHTITWHGRHSLSRGQ
jgi:protein-S-isoprenylcysteine O-methyltransferase Ste14